jgi:hypothetical protein
MQTFDSVITIGWRWSTQLIAHLVIGLLAYFYWYLLFHNALLFIFLPVALTFFPGLFVIPYLIFRAPLRIQGDGFYLLGFFFSWHDVEQVEFRRLPNPRGPRRRAIVFKCSQSCLNRLNALSPLRKFLMVVLIRPLEIAMDKRALAFPAGLTVSLKELRDILNKSIVVNEVAS